MEFSSLNLIQQEPHFSKSLKARLGHLNQRIETALSNREKVRDAVAEARDADPTTLDFESVLSIPVHRIWLARLWQEELAIRRHLVAFDEARLASRRQAYDKAISAHLAAEKDVHEKLEAIGYHSIPDPQKPGQILPIMLQSHPMVFAAKRERDEWFAKCHDHTFTQNNAEAIRQLEEQLAEARDRAVPA